LQCTTIAGVRFALSGAIDDAAFAPAFRAFRHGATIADLECDVSCLGPDEALTSQSLAPEKPWSFTACNGVCELVRRSQEGEALWRIAGPLAFDSAAVTWNPRRFADFYGCYERAWSTGLGLSLLVLRLRAQGGLVLHGTAAEVDGQGILCVGISGTGKSTLARLLDAAGAMVLTDERPVLRQWPAPTACRPEQPEAIRKRTSCKSGFASEQTAAFRVYGSPWPSSAGFACNAWAPLRRIYFLGHGATDRLTRLSPPDAVRRLIHVATLPWQEPVLLDACLATMGAVLCAVPCAVLAFRPTPDVVDLIRNDLRRPAAEAYP
jgi:hypothetical protein